MLGFERIGIMSKRILQNSTKSGEVGFLWFCQRHPCFTNFIGTSNKPSSVPSMAGPLGMIGHKGERTMGFFPSKPASTSNNALAGNSRKHSSCFEPLDNPTWQTTPESFADLDTCFFHPLSSSLPFVLRLEVSSCFDRVLKTLKHPWTTLFTFPTC